MVTVPADGRALSLRVDAALAAFVNEQVLAPLAIEPEAFWAGLAEIVDRFAPANAALLERRDELQRSIDEWHHANPASATDVAAYESFLTEIGYLEPVVEAPSVNVANVDPEVATISGPQLVVPVTIARYAINAANARWASLYDAFYGTDVIPGLAEAAPGYDEARGVKVIAAADDFLDEAVPLVSATHADVATYRVVGQGVVALLADGREVAFTQPDVFAGLRGVADQPTALLLRHHGLHIEIVIDRTHPVGKQHHAGVSDVILESAVTTICDLEDSVAVVDAEDKVLAYENWLGLMRGDLTETFIKGGRAIVRTLVDDREYVAPDGSALRLPGRSLMFARNVGHLMTTDAVLTADGNEIPEGILDAAITTAAAMHGLRGIGTHSNSRTGSIYIVKPKMHGPAEVAFTDELFGAVEALLGLESNTIKVGIMDEEKRTTLNLGACIEAARERVVFINTGFLDRTGDEIHTCFEAGPVVRKADMKTEAWLDAYEDANVDVGLASGLATQGQIGKGMWAMPSEMAAMVEAKISHPRSGANCAWVPSPTAATLHALHYHQVDVAAVQTSFVGRQASDRRGLLTLPLLGTRRAALSDTEIDHELDTNIQSILGYVVRWVGQGIGCSTVPDLADVGLMEDRATLRISSQHVANWLRHGVVDEARVRNSFQRMADLVDTQNADDPNYTPMAGAVGDANAPLAAALELVFGGKDVPNGYTEPALHRWRKITKQHANQTIHHTANQKAETSR